MVVLWLSCDVVRYSLIPKSWANKQGVLYCVKSYEFVMYLTVSAGW